MKSQNFRMQNGKTLALASLSLLASLPQARGEVVQAQEIRFENCHAIQAKAGYLIGLGYSRFTCKGAVLAGPEPKVLDGTFIFQGPNLAGTGVTVNWGHVSGSCVLKNFDVKKLGQLKIHFPLLQSAAGSAALGKGGGFISMWNGNAYVQKPGAGRGVIQGVVNRGTCNFDSHFQEGFGFSMLESVVMSLTWKK